MSTMRAALDLPANEKPEADRAAGAETAGRRAAAQAVDHRDRDADPRPLRDLRQARLEAASRWTTSAWRPTRAPRHADARRARPLHRRMARRLRRGGGGAARGLRRGRCSQTIRDFGDAHAVWMLRFGTIARWFVGWEAERAAAVAERHAEIERRADIQFGRRRLHPERPRRPHRRDARRHASPSTISRPARRRPTGRSSPA